MIAKNFRLKRNQIGYLLDKGEKSSSRLFIVKYIKNDNDFSKFCVIISRKMSAKAVGRNRLRRQIYEAIRTSGISKNRVNMDIALIPKKPIANRTFPEIKEDLILLMNRITSQNGYRQNQ